jgi:hypothetical protein
MKDSKKSMDKQDKKSDPMEKEAKLSALKDLRSHMMGMMGEGLGDKMNKVTVAAPNKADLKKGLDKAKELVGKAPMDDEEAGEDPTEEATETPEEEATEESTEGDDQSSEDNRESDQEKRIAELEAKLEELKSLIKK